MVEAPTAEPPTVPLISSGPLGTPVLDRVSRELLRRRVNEFLDSVNDVLKDAHEHLPDFEIGEMIVSATFSRGGEVSFAGFGGLNLTGTRTVEFTIRPKR